MKINKLHAVNIKVLKDITIEPQQNIILLSGRNGSGKTSILDSILYALAGKRHIPDKALRNGERSGEIELDMGDIKVKRTFTAKGTYLNIEGSQPGLGQEYLNTITNAIFLDPTEFINADGKKHKELMLTRAGKYDEYITLLEKYKKTYDNRRHEKRILSDLEAKVTDDMLAVNNPGSKIDITGLVQEIQNATNSNRLISEKRNTINMLRAGIKDKEERIAELEVRIQRDKQKISEVLSELDSITETDTGPMTEKLKTAEAHNRTVDEYRRTMDILTEYKGQTSTVNALEADIKDIETQRDILFESIEYPVSGLKLDENGLTYNGMPFSEESDGNKLRIALAVIMKEQSDLRVIRVKHGAFLDKDAMDIIKEMADENDFQVWIETVNTSEGEVSYVVDNGDLV